MSSITELLTFYATGGIPVVKERTIKEFGIFSVLFPLDPMKTRQYADTEVRYSYIEFRQGLTEENQSIRVEGNKRILHDRSMLDVQTKLGRVEIRLKRNQGLKALREKPKVWIEYVHPITLRNVTYETYVQQGEPFILGFLQDEDGMLSPSLTLYSPSYPEEEAIEIIPTHDYVLLPYSRYVYTLEVVHSVPHHLIQKKSWIDMGRVVKSDVHSWKAILQRIPKRFENQREWPESSKTSHFTQTTTEWNRNHNY